MKKFYYSLVAVALVALCSCSNKMNQLAADYFTVSPEVLEAVNGEVPATIHGTFPAKFFGKKIYMELFVKVDKDWRSSDRELRNFGYEQA